jgi:hypothetical protein
MDSGTRGGGGGRGGGDDGVSGGGGGDGAVADMVMAVGGVSTAPAAAIDTPAGRALGLRGARASAMFQPIIELIHVYERAKSGASIDVTADGVAEKVADGLLEVAKG